MAMRFIGSHVADHLLRLGHRVVVLDDLSGGFIENVPPDATFARMALYPSRARLSKADR